MPFIELKTNVKLKDSIKETLSKELGEKIQILHKTENWLMINFIDQQSMYFKGNNSPCAILEVKLYGEADRSVNEFTETITQIVAKLTNIDPSRIYINYFSTQNWGYSGFNF